MWKKIKIQKDALAFEGVPMVGSLGEEAFIMPLLVTVTTLDKMAFSNKLDKNKDVHQLNLIWS